MNFLTPSEVIDKPCKDILSYPLQCFQEMFFATPAVVGTFFVGIGGFAIAVVIWGAIFALALFTVFFVLKHLYKFARYFFTQTKVGQKVASVVPLQKYMQKFCCKAQEVQPRKIINTQAIGDYGANIVSKIHGESKWFKSALKHVSFGKSDSDSSANNARSPSKSSPQKSLSRISSFTPKLLSPKHKQQ